MTTKEARKNLDKAIDRVADAECAYRSRISTETGKAMDVAYAAMSTAIDAFAEAVRSEARAGHNENCDVFEYAPDCGPSSKPCNCRTAHRDIP